MENNIHTKSYRCSNCGAPLSLEDAQQEILRCHYCGNDHTLVNASAEAEVELQTQKRLGGIIAPFVLGPLIGICSFFAVRDFWWSSYEGVPAMAVGVFFLVLGFMGFRVPAALGYCVFLYKTQYPSYLGLDGPVLGALPRDSRNMVYFTPHS